MVNRKTPNRRFAILVNAALSTLLAFAADAVLTGCASLTPTQQANLELELQLTKSIGIDAVQIWCTSSNIIYVVAQNASAQSRVTAALGANAAAATAACPMIAAVTGNSNIKVVTQSTAPALTPAPATGG